jgi:hypothetical protein
MSNGPQNPEQASPEPGDDLRLDKETLKDLEPRSEDLDNVRGGTGRIPGPSALCNSVGALCTAAPTRGGTIQPTGACYFG